MAISIKASELKKGDRVRIPGRDGFFELAADSAPGDQPNHFKYEVTTDGGTESFEVPADSTVDVFLIEELPTQVD